MRHLSPIARTDVPWLLERVEALELKLSFIRSCARRSQELAECEVCAEIERSLETEFPLWRVQHEALRSKLEAAESRCREMEKARDEQIEKAAREIMFSVDETSKALKGPRFTFEEFEREIADILRRALKGEQP